jgi:hypothetical protein
LAAKAWFPYFHLYGPTEAPFDQRWILPSIEKMKCYRYRPPTLLIRVGEVIKLSD